VRGGTLAVAVTAALLIAVPATAQLPSVPDLPSTGVPTVPVPVPVPTVPTEPLPTPTLPGTELPSDTVIPPGLVAGEELPAASVTVPLTIDTDHADAGGVQLLSAGFSTPPAVGQPTTLELVAQDPKAATSGVIVDFGEGARKALSACRPGRRTGPFQRGKRLTFGIPYTFTTTGAHSMAVTVLSGDCGHTRETSQELAVDVAAPAGTAARRLAHAAAVPCPNAFVPPGAVSNAALVKSLHCLVNVVRGMAGLTPLKWSRRLTRAATFHTRAMTSRGIFSHQLPGEPGLGLRARRAGYRYEIAENLAAGTGLYASPFAIIIGWLQSPPHRANLLWRGDRAIGIALVPRYPLRPSSPPAATYTAEFGPKR